MTDGLLRVLHLLGTSRPGGVETFVLELARHFDRRRIELSVCILGDGGPVAEELCTLGIKTQVLDVTGNSKVRSALACYRYMVSEHFDILHANVGGRMVRYLARLAGCRVVFTHVHGPPDQWIEEVRRGDANASQRIARMYGHGANHVLACSHSVSRMLAKGDPSLAGKLSVVPYGVDLEVFRPVSRDCSEVEALRREIGLPLQSLVVGFVGRLVKQKGLPYLLAAGGNLALRFPNVCFLIVGDGPCRRDTEAESSLLAPGRFLFLGERRDVPRLMRLFDMLVVPSEWEAFGIVNLEAMATARPVVAFNVDGIPEIVMHGETGLLVPHRDVAALAAAIAQLLENPSQREQMGLAGRRRAEQYFDVQTMARTIESLYVTAC